MYFNVMFCVFALYLIPQIQGLNEQVPLNGYIHRREAFCRYALKSRQHSDMRYIRLIFLKILELSGNMQNNQVLKFNVNWCCITESIDDYNYKSDIHFDDS
jgi:hypothetical protein